MIHFITIHTSPTPVPPVTCKSQQPAIGNLKPIPTSPPGRDQFEPSCFSRKMGRTRCPWGPSATIWIGSGKPTPILQIIFPSFPTLGTPPRNKPTNPLTLSFPVPPETRGLTYQEAMED